MRKILLTISVTACVVGCNPANLARSPNLYCEAGENPFNDVPPAFQSSQVTLIYGTDRVNDAKPGEPIQYGIGRDRALTVGETVVTIGEKMEWQELVKQSCCAKREHDIPVTVTSIEPKVRVDPPGVVELITDGIVTESPDWLQAHLAAKEQVGDLLRKQLALTPRKEVFLFVHGYNNTFDEAAMRMAALWHLMGRPGVPVMYSWPAGHSGLVRGYTYDRESSEFTVHHLKTMLRAIAACPEVQKIHVLGHSRGTGVLTTALRELYIEARAKGPDAIKATKIGRLVLAAADMDWDVVQQTLGAERVVALPEHSAIYVSQSDKAIGVAEWLFASTQRLGRLGAKDLTPQQKAMAQRNKYLDCINVEVNTDFMGHAYFIESPAVLSDVILFWRDGRPVGAEGGRPLDCDPNEVFLTIHEDYPRCKVPAP